MKKLFLAALSFLPFCSFAQSLVVNEVQVANIDEFIDPSYNYGGWIELYNPTDANIQLTGMYISDDPDNLTKFKFITNHGAVPAGGFKTIWFDHNAADGTYGSGAKTQVRFKLNTEGGTIYISDTGGNLLLSQNYPAAISRCSYARTTDNGSAWRWTGTPTPGESNNNSVFADTQLPAPVISHDSGLLTESIKITAEAEEGVTVKYITDGATPTATTGFTLTENGLNITSTKVIRFRAFKEGYLPSPVVTRSYIFHDKNWTLPIVSVVTNNKNLYDNTIGVYTVGTNGVTGRGQYSKSNKNMDWERPVNFEYIDTDGTCKLNQEATFYVCGGWSRHWEPTSFKLKAEKRYEGMNYYPYAFFDEKPFIKNKCIIMRNGGNDTWSRSKDATIQHIIQSSGIYLDGQAYNPCHVFINGKYHAMLNMREPSNKFYAYANYGYDTDFVDAFELSPDFGGQVLKEGTTEAWSKLLQLASKATDATSYEDIATNYLDIDEFANYMAAECWLGCSDWLTNNNNTKWFRSTIGNGRFRFVMFDTDSAFDNSNMLGSIKGSSKNNVMALFNRMAKSERFKKHFITSFCLVDGSVFTADRAKEAANYVGNLTDAALELDNHDPWSSCNDVSSKVSSTTTHTQRINSLKSYFSLTGGTKVALSSNVNAAQILVNDQVVPTGKFDGTLFMPVTLKATAPAGYNFVGWYQGDQSSSEVFAKGSTWQYYDKGSLDGTDWKTSTTGFSSGKAPLGYGKTGLGTTLSYGSNSNNKYPTYYFRKQIDLTEEPKDDDTFILDYTIDDGLVVYVNGVEAGRYNMPGGTPTWNTYASSYAEGNPDSGSMKITPSLFKKGENIIAVEVHNNSGSSTDIYWDASLTRTYNNIENSQLISDEREFELNTTAQSQLKAIFEPIPEECLTAAGSTPIVINEISAGNEVFINDYYKKNDWIELYNTTSQDIDLAGMYLSDNPDKLQKHQITAAETDGSTIIPAHGYKIIWADKLDPISQLHASFKLANNDEECVIISAADLSWSNTLTYSAHSGEESVGRYPDGGNTIYHMSHPTIGSHNILTSYAQWLSGEDKNFDYESYLSSIDTPVVEGSVNENDAYYTVDGIRLSAPQRGINIVRHTNANGTVTTKKIFVK